MTRVVENIETCTGVQDGGGITRNRYWYLGCWMALLKPGNNVYRTLLATDT